MFNRRKKVASVPTACAAQTDRQPERHTILASRLRMFFLRLCVLCVLEVNQLVKTRYYKYVLAMHNIGHCILIRVANGTGVHTL